MVVRFCRSCRCLILSDFRFCPYCGEPAPRGPDLREALERPFSRLEGPEDGAADAPPPRRSADPFARADGELRRLEADIAEMLAACPPGAGRDATS